MKKRILAGLLILSLIATGMGVIGNRREIRAADAPETIDVSVISSGTRTLANEGTYIITGTSGSGKNIVIGNGTTQVFTIILRDLNITYNGVPMAVQSNATVNLILEGSNKLTSGAASVAALQVPANANLIIGGEGNLGLTGNGTSSTGIGGSRTPNNGTGNITINSGIIDVNAAFGIGAGYQNTIQGTVTINGGKISTSVVNGTASVGIGGNSNSSTPTKVTINGGTIKVTALGSQISTGLGLGNANTNGKASNVTMNGGNIYGEVPSGKGTPFCNLSTGALSGFAKVTVPIAGSSDNKVDSVYVDGKDYHIDSLHDSTDGLYLYLPVGSHKIVVKDEGNTHIYSIEVTGSPNTYDTQLTATLDKTLTDAFRPKDSKSTSIRTKGNQGIRFANEISNELRDAVAAEDGYEIEEYGMLVQKKEKLLVNQSIDESGGLTSEYVDFTLDPDTLEPKSGLKGTAYKKGEKDVIYKQEDGKTIYTAVLYNINQSNYTTDYVVKPYIVLKDAEDNQTILYGDEKADNIYRVAGVVLADEDNGLTQEELNYLQDIVDAVGANE